MPPTQNPYLLFIYGTLRKGESSQFSQVLQAGSAPVGDGVARGILYSLGDYPGMVNGDGEVRGEVVRVKNPALWDDLDEYEGQDYERVIRTIKLVDGGEVQAWAYLYVGNVSGKPLIPGGDWRRK